MRIKTLLKGLKYKTKKPLVIFLPKGIQPEV